MKIAVMVPMFLTTDGGGRVGGLQAERLTKEGHEVTIFTLAADRKLESVGVRVMGMPRSMFWHRIYRLAFPLDVFKIIRWLPRLKGFDRTIVHYYPMTVMASLARRRYGVRYTFWYHGIMPPYLFPSFYERLYMRLWILLTRLTVRNADDAVAVSRYGQKELKRNTGLDSTVEYNRIDPARFHPGIDGSAVRKKYRVDDAPMILSVGALRPVKGVDLLIGAFHLVRRELPDARLLIVGAHDFGYYARRLKEMAGEGVVFTGVVSNEDLPPYYAACDVYATGSQWEMHSLVVLEAQACGKPVVTFAIEPFQEELGDNDTLVEVGNIEAFAQACLWKLGEARAESASYGG